MTSKSTKWRIKKISNSARKNIFALTPDSHKEVLLQLEAQEKNPLQRGIKKIEGKKNIFRGRIGDFRYYFRLLPKSKSIEVLLFDIRGSIKQKRIQKL